MENPTENTSNDTPTTDPRPLGYWLRAVDALLSAQFRAALAADDVSRREWMTLTVLAGEVEAPGLAERLRRGGKHLRRLAERGWVTEAEGDWTLTDEGHAARERLAASVDAIRMRVAGAVPDADYATTIATLQAIARELGGDEASARDFGRGFGRGFGGRRGFGRRGFEASRRGFGPLGHGDHGIGPRDHSFGPREQGFGPGHPFHGERCGGRHEGRHAESAYERGFQAGFAARPQNATSA